VNTDDYQARLSVSYILRVQHCIDGWNGFITAASSGASSVAQSFMRRHVLKNDAVNAATAVALCRRSCRRFPLLPPRPEIISITVRDRSTRGSLGDEKGFRPVENLSYTRNPQRPFLVRPLCVGDQG